MASKIESLDEFHVEEVVLIKTESGEDECNSSFDGKHGKITRFLNDKNKDDTVEIEIAECFSFLFSFEDRGNRKVRLKIGELIKIDDRVDIQTRVNIRIGKDWHHCCDIGNSIGDTCIIKDCVEISTIETMCNIWGSIYAFKTCKNHHKEFHGMWGDNLPPLKKLEKNLVN